MPATGELSTDGSAMGHRWAQVRQEAQAYTVRAQVTPKGEEHGEEETVHRAKPGSGAHSLKPYFTFSAIHRGREREPKRHNRSETDGRPPGKIK